MTPLSQCRVLDLGIITAGAATTAILADLGAEVIKIESPTYKDPFRRWSGETFPGEHPDLPPFFRMTNRGKLNAGIDLKSPAGRDVFLRLVSRSDMVVENFSRGVLARLGLDYATLKSANPDIILASISSQGENGPDAAYVSFGSTLEAMAGMAAITGYADGPPVVSGIELNYPDQVVAMFAASMIATAWYARQNGAGGVHLDLSQLELTSFLCGEAFLNPESARPRGNAQEEYPVQDCFRTVDGIWIAISVRGADLSTLALLAGGGSAECLSAWIALQTAEAALAALHAAGLMATPALDGIGVLADRDAGWSRALVQGGDGEMLKGFLFTDAGFTMNATRPAGLMGADSRDVLLRVGGYSTSEIDALIAAGAIVEDTAFACG